MISSYQPIENYGIVGNMRTAALVGMNGSIDWLCLPRFDSPSVFAAILDAQKGGRFQIAPAGDDFRNKQFYWPDTNILITRFLHADGIGEIEDYMPVSAAGTSPDQLVRRVRVVRGRVSFHLECNPAFDYARAKPEIHLGEHGAHFKSRELSLGLASSVPLDRTADGVAMDFTLGEGENVTFILRLLSADDSLKCCPNVGQAEELFRATVAFWRRWLSKCTYSGRWREVVQRSALTLKLLSYEPTGAIDASRDEIKAMHIAMAVTTTKSNRSASRKSDLAFTTLRPKCLTGRAARPIVSGTNRSIATGLAIYRLACRTHNQSQYFGYRPSTASPRRSKAKHTPRLA